MNAQFEWKEKLLLADDDLYVDEGDYDGEDIEGEPRKYELHFGFIAIGVIHELDNEYYCMLGSITSHEEKSFPLNQLHVAKKWMQNKFIELAKSLWQQ